MKSFTVLATLPWISKALSIEQPYVTLDDPNMISLDNMGDWNPIYKNLTLAKCKSTFRVYKSEDVYYKCSKFTGVEIY